MTLHTQTPLAAPRTRVSPSVHSTYYSYED